MNSKAAQLRLIDLNLVEGRREFARWSRSSAIAEEAGFLRIRGESPTSSTCLRVDPSIPAEQTIDRMREFLDERESGFILWARDPVDRDIEALLQAQDIRPLGSTPWMVLQKRLQDRPVPEGTELRVVETEQMMGHVAEINSEAYTALGLPADQCRSMYGVPARALEPHVHTVVAYVSEEPAATAMVLLSHSIGGIYWVGTKERFRRQGLAEACTRAVGNWAFDQQARFVALHASPMGEPVYQRMGYETVSAHRLYWIKKSQLER